MGSSSRKILVTGAAGFIGKNLVLRLSEKPDTIIIKFLRGDDTDHLYDLVQQADSVVHLAGENRPDDESMFSEVNTGLTSLLCDAIQKKIALTGNHLPMIFASSTQADLDNAYGRSKLAAETIVRELSDATGNPSVIFRLPGVFGKWCKSNYNSVVATFCYNVARGLPIEISDPERLLQLVYIDDVVTSMMDQLEAHNTGSSFSSVSPEYTVTLGELASEIKSFYNCKTTLTCGHVGTGFLRALYATYVSYLPSEKFSYDLPQHVDKRGVFVEILKTPDCGQVSYFTAHPGVTRGGHYHHTKTEKFLVIKGQALFRFRHLLSDELVEIRTDGAQPEVVDTIPGWSHDITNIGDSEMLVMLWANEIFNQEFPDTITYEV